MSAVKEIHLSDKSISQSKNRTRLLAYHGKKKLKTSVSTKKTGQTELELMRFVVSSMCYHCAKCTEHFLNYAVVNFQKLLMIRKNQEKK